MKYCHENEFKILVEERIAYRRQLHAAVSVISQDEVT